MPDEGAPGRDEEQSTDSGRSRTERVEDSWGKWEESVRKLEVSG